MTTAIQTTALPSGEAAFVLAIDASGAFIKLEPNHRASLVTNTASQTSLELPDLPEGGFVEVINLATRPSNGRLAQDFTVTAVGGLPIDGDASGIRFSYHFNSLRLYRSASGYLLTRAS